MQFIEGESIQKDKIWMKCNMNEVNLKLYFKKKY